MALHALSRLTLAVAAVAMVGVGAALTVSGGSMFSPGALHAGDSTPATLGGVSSHAELSRACGSCHATMGSTRPMAVRCLECHTDIRDQFADSTALHGSRSDVRACLTCHTEHLGALASLTRMDGSPAAHAQLGFPLDGAHRDAPCAGCHTREGSGRRFTRAPRTCIGCHAQDDTHEGEFGTDCASCHTTSTWEGASFSHDVFPLDHGGEGRIPCATCHEDRTNYKSYTCYGCHEHSPARVAAEHRGEVRSSDLRDCVRCHAGGREHGDEGERREGRRRR